MLASVITRLRIIETDINRLVTEGGYDRGKKFICGISQPQMPLRLRCGTVFSSRRTGSLSLLSEDSFHSCFDDFSSCLDDPSVRETLTFDRSSLAFYQEGLEEAANGNVDFRKSRAEFCGCDSDVDFAAKLWCLRRAFANIVADEHRRLWLTNAGRQIMADLLRHDGRETREFYSAYDDIIEFVNNEVNHEKMWEELSARKVADLGMWDVLLDFVLLDAFDDITHPPATIIALLSNKFLTRKMKESSLSTVLWTTISAKRRRLLYADGFINHFYNLTLIMTPSLALAFFGGSSDAYRELCQFFKEQVCSFVVEIFNLQNIRYTSLEELTEDLHSSLASRIETLQTRLSNELLPT
ncbi:hypothetical protein L596_015187 [Steinernema carpocapsae]|uniref:Mitoguardin n=1 Tax=Steinernema carpocapsae TaxID=34508 RepID=A0A4U5NFI4_STECR|nr:hypothetical protein L596_015187 [Steinernema carpocapsae]